MTWSLFYKNIEDEDMCFMRDIMSVTGFISDIISIQQTKEIIQAFLRAHGLWDKFIKYSKLQTKAIIIKNCYPSDQCQKYAHAAILLSLTKLFNFNDNQWSYVLYQTLKIIKQMDIDENGKHELIKNYILKNEFDDKDLENFIISQYLEIF